MHFEIITPEHGHIHNSELLPIRVYNIQPGEEIAAVENLAKMQKRWSELRPKYEELMGKLAAATIDRAYPPPQPSWNI